MLPQTLFPSSADDATAVPVRVLLLEDDPLSVEIVAGYLRSISFAEARFHSCRTLAEALEYLKNAEVDLVISDLHLPDSAGARTIEALAQQVGCPVIAITSDLTPRLREATIAAGAYDFLPKVELTQGTLTRLMRLAWMHTRTFRSLRESEARFRSLSALTSDWFWETDEHHRFAQVPTRISSVTGLPPAAYVGKARWDVAGLRPLRGDWQAHRQVLARRESFRDLDVVQERPDGKRFYLQISGEPVYDAAGKFTGYRGTAKNVTAQRRADAAVRESEARFRDLTELSSDWYWEQDAALRFVGTSGLGDGRAGITPEAHIGLRRWELPRTEIVGQTWDEHRKVLAERQPFHDLVLRRTSSAGEVRYISVDGRPIFDERGEFMGYRGVAKDVTARKVEDDRLRRFRAALDAAADAVLLVDARTGKYVDLNEAACLTFGYSREEMLAMTVDQIRVDHPRERLLAVFGRLVNDPESEQLDIAACRRKDGSVFPVEFTRRLLQTGDGPIVVATARDLTERLKADERQAALLRYQERVARFGQRALAQREPAELIEKAVQEILEALDAEAVAYVEREPGGGELVLRALVGVAGPFHPAPVPAQPGSPLVDAMASGMRRVVDGAQLPFAWASGLRTTALLPVPGENGVRGMLCVGYKTASPFAPEAFSFAEGVASVLSTALLRIDSEARVAYLAQFDPLTGLPNRALLADRFSQMIMHAKRRDAPLAVLFVDLDGFKLVNDTLGHAGGDALLKEVALRLQSAVRGGDTVARISGDEFAIVLGDMSQLEDAALVAQKVIDKLAATVEIGGKEVFVTASVGIAVYPGDGADADTLIGAADAAMYRAKQSGRNTFHFFTSEINQRSRARARLAAELRRALEREEFVLFYQPKVDLGTRAVIGAEALLRWKHPERGMVSPMEFIPVLEETGQIGPAGDWVLRRACADLKEWQGAGHAVVPIAVNLSARQFRRADLDTHIRSLVTAAGIDPQLIELEITESQLMHDPQHAIRVMRALRDAGMTIAVDDFGTGFSSLAYLNRFPLNALKIDRSFVKDITTDKDHAVIARTIIEMAHSLGFTVVAEGVETEEQAALLRLLRCQLAQGFLFAKPMPAGELVRLLAKR